MNSLFKDVSHAIKDVSRAIDHMVEGHIDNSNRIWIQLSQSAYVGGDIVSGTVEMDCLVPFFAKGVLLKMKGFERVFWQYQESEFEGEGQNRKSVIKTHEVKENKEFFKTSIVVYPHQGTVAPGHYSFPFQYQLPASLPGTYFEEGGHKSHDNAYYAKILYKVKATVDVAFRHNLKHTQKLVVNERFDQLVAPSFGENSKSFLTARGSLHIRTWLDKNAYFPGETMICKLKANNTSVKPTRKVNIKVHHVLELKAHHKVKRDKHCVYEQSYAGFDPCFLGVKYMPFCIPVSLRPSTLQGSHVHSSYVFEIECDIPGATDLSVCLPVRILAAQFLWSSVPPQPANAPLPPNVSTRPPWQPDHEAPKCHHCSMEFSLFKRRHHCRHCHKVYCAKCTKQTSTITKLKYKDPVRVCDKCAPIAKSGGEKFQSRKKMYEEWQAQLFNQQQLLSPATAPPNFA